MTDFNLEETIMINAEVAYGMRECYTNEAKILYAYILLNTYADNYKQQIYADAVKKHLSEEDYGKVVAETSFGKFDNLTFWVNKTIKEIENYCLYANGYEKKSFMEDAIKGAFSFFLYIANGYNHDAAMQLIDAVKKSDILQFLIPITFLEQQKFATLPVENGDDTSDDERYLDLLELEFSPYELFDSLKSSAEEETRSCAITQKKRKRENKNPIEIQMSFRHLFKK